MSFPSEQKSYPLPPPVKRWNRLVFSSWVCFPRTCAIIKLIIVLNESRKEQVARQPAHQSQRKPIRTRFLIRQISPQQILPQEGKADPVRNRGVLQIWTWSKALLRHAQIHGRAIPDALNHCPTLASHQLPRKRLIALWKLLVADLPAILAGKPVVVRPSHGFFESGAAAKQGKRCKV